MSKKIFNESVKDTPKQAKRVRNSASNQQEAARVMNQEITKTSREVWKDYQTAHAEMIAAKCVAKETVKRGYTFEEAKHATDNFTRVYTTSDDEKSVTKYKVINGTAYGYKVITPLLVDDVLRSFESYNMIAEAERKQAAKAKRAEEKEDAIKARAAEFGITIEQARAMAIAGVLKI